ncbi:CidA/LrgA family protein [Simiduia sp. 21SJ11W-1]|uniref:CidA/LrgA family protein n=1 Tax=Simiduia sp. 21SJ11W-1 TaxID=2909669 RepID=UPI00209ED6BB|nr:CidA/LrgA family protein [Simiduia sp. 21SJ11W-1]UTA48030.1 CidA/LrgA family protein [Simiduia sp. 21SJ11W-1]
MIAGLLILIGFQLAGELISLWLDWPIPGAVVGMVLLLLCLRTASYFGLAGWVSPTERASQALINHLSLLFLPAGVGIFFLPADLQAQWPAVLAAMVGATLLCMLLSAWLLGRFGAKG